MGGRTENGMGEGQDGRVEAYGSLGYWQVLTFVVVNLKVLSLKITNEIFKYNNLWTNAGLPW